MLYRHTTSCKCQIHQFRFVAYILLAVTLCYASQQKTIASEHVFSAKTVLPYIVHHTQGWGHMGVDTCAFTPGTQPLPLQIGSEEYKSGLGLHAPGEIWLFLGKCVARFEASVGVQHQDHKQGLVIFRVYADDSLVFDSGPMRQTDSAKQISIPTSNVNYLRLEYSDAGDGMICDCADWVNIRLVPASEPDQIKIKADRVDIAPFARVLTWNPFVKDGTHARRTEEFPARDLFDGNLVQPDADGFYTVPLTQCPHNNDIAKACIGLEWLEHRRICQAVIRFAEDAPPPEGVVFEYWALTIYPGGGTPGVSRWQGHWERLVTPVKHEQDCWIVTISQNTPGWQKLRTMKIRWLIPLALCDNRLKQLEAYTDTIWRDTEVTLHTLSTDLSQDATVSLYNGAWLEAPKQNAPLTWKLKEQKSLKLSLRYADPQPWTRCDQTVLRLSLPDGNFGIKVTDIISNGYVFVKHAGIIAVTPENSDRIESLIADTTHPKTILEEVRQLPDQTFAQALKHVHRPDANHGPTYLSLAHGNKKFKLNRDGSIEYDIPDHKKPIKKVSFQLQEQQITSVERHLDEGWMPIPVITHTAGKLSLCQRTFVAPVGKFSGQDKAPWFRDKPLCVVEYALTNNSAQAQNVNLCFRCLANVSTKLPAQLKRVPRGIDILADKTPCALLDMTNAKDLNVDFSEESITLTGKLLPGSTASCVLFIPGWTVFLDELPAVCEVPRLLEDTRQHWRQCLSGTIRITTPDPMLNNVITASRIHCMLAARNENGTLISPWIGSDRYGPLESEAHSIIRGMAFMGHSDFARRGLDFFINRYNDAGYLTTGYTMIGTGWHLWALGEFFALDRNDNWLRQIAPEVTRVCKWILKQRKKTQQMDNQKKRYPEYGLMPPGVLADWGVYSHYFYLNGNYYAGLHWTGKALRTINNENAAEILDSAENFRKDILHAFHYVQDQAPVLPLRNGTWVPAYPTQVYCPMPIADMYWNDDVGRSWCYDVELGAHHLIPMGVLPISDPSIDWMMNHMEDVQFLKSGWYYYPQEKNKEDWFNLGGFAKVQPYYARNVEVDALRDDVKPFIRSYFNSLVSLLNCEDLSLWEHFVNGAFNKTHETGYFLHQSRLMFIMERGDTLWLAPFIPDYWLEDGMTIDIQDAPTFFGKTGYTITSHLSHDNIQAVINPPLRQTPREIVLRLRHPRGKTMISAEVTGAREYKISSEDSTIHIKPQKNTIYARVKYVK